jgi:hypothetical protein
MDERDDLLERTADSEVEDGAAAEPAASGESLTDERNTEVVRDVVLDTGIPAAERLELAREKIFARVLDIALTDPELVGIATGGGLELDWLRAPIVERAPELWPAVVNEMSGLEALVARSDAAAAPPAAPLAESGLAGVVRRIRMALAAALPRLARLLGNRGLA